METYSFIIQSITTVGFPIAMCLIMVYLNKEQDVRHAEETRELRTAIENNTLAITKLVDKLEK